MKWILSPGGPWRENLRREGGSVRFSFADNILFLMIKAELIVIVDLLYLDLKCQSMTRP